MSCNIKLWISFNEYFLFFLCSFTIWKIIRSFIIIINCSLIYIFLVVCLPFDEHCIILVFYNFARLVGRFQHLLRSESWGFELKTHERKLSFCVIVKYRTFRIASESETRRKLYKKYPIFLESVPKFSIVFYYYVFILSLF